ncbi:unnamed protein product [Sympodiomycopsis kandeliae]
MAPTSTPFKGALKGKRKPDLLEIAQALGLPQDQDSRRDELENAVRDHLISNRSALETNDRFEGLYQSLDKADRRSGRASGAVDSESSDTGSPLPARASRKLNGVANAVTTEAEKVASDASSFGTQIRTKARKSLDDLASAFRANATEARQEVSDVAAGAEHFGESVKSRIRAFERRVRKRADKSFKRAQAFASDIDNLVRLFLAVEFTILVLTVLPTQYLQFGESSAEAFLKHGKLYNSIPHWAVTVPDPRGLITLAFWQPILVWIFWALAIPDVACHLITFRRRHEGSPVTFTYVRLALLVFLTRHVPAGAPRALGVAAGQPVAAQLGLVGKVQANLSYDLVPLDHSTQILATALAAGLATYEVISTRPRAG